MSERDGGPAFPVNVGRVTTLTTSEGSEVSCYPMEPTGMTLLDYFAAKAMLGLLTAESHPQAGGFPAAGATREETAIYFAQSAYILADAMLAERAK